jgi:hypothetical protein
MALLGVPFQRDGRGGVDAAIAHLAREAGDA